MIDAKKSRDRRKLRFRFRKQFSTDNSNGRFVVTAYVGKRQLKTLTFSVFILWYGKRPTTVRTLPIDRGNGYWDTGCVCSFPSRRPSRNRDGRRTQPRAEPKRSAKRRRLSRADCTADDYYSLLFGRWATARNSIFLKIRLNSLALYGTEQKIEITTPKTTLLFFFTWHWWDQLLVSFPSATPYP